MRRKIGIRMVSTTTLNINNFLCFLIFVDGMFGKEALVILASLSQLISEKMDKPILHVRGWINGWIAMIVVRLY